MSFLDAVCAAFDHQRLAPPGALIVAAVSGGADSLALLHALHTLQNRLKIRLCAATFDHGLRGAASAADVDYVNSVCRALGVPVTTGRAEQPAASEADLRAARYAFLARAARAAGAAHIATGHHADDQAETVLLRLVRGAASAGMRAMLPQSPLPGHPGLTLIRPLLALSRTEIDAYCTAHGLEPRQDSTNLDTTYARNRIRHEIMPVLRHINPQTNRALARFAAHAAIDHDYMQQQLQQITAPFVTRTEQRITIARPAFCDLHPALQRRFVHQAARDINPTAEVGTIHIESACQLALAARTGAVAVLPGGLHLRVDYEQIVIERASAPHPPPPFPLLEPGTVHAVTLPGDTPLPGGWTLRIRFQPTQQPPATCIWIAPGAPVTLRTRRPGDRFAPPGLGGQTQKLKEWLIDHKVPRHLRDSLPLLVVGDVIAALWASAPAPAVSADFAVPQAHKTAVCIAVLRSSDEP